MDYHRGLDCSRGLEYSRGLDLELEKNWEQMSESRHFLTEHAGEWQVLNAGESRRLEKEEKRMRSEILQKRRKQAGAELCQAQVQPWLAMLAATRY